MGLLDVFNTYEGQQALGLLAAAGPRSDGAGFGQRLQEGLGSANKWKENQTAQAFAKLQMQEAQVKLQEQQRAMDDQTQQRAILRGFYGSNGMPQSGQTQPTIGSGPGLSSDMMGSLPPEMRTPTVGAMPGYQSPSAPQRQAAPVAQTASADLPDKSGKFLQYTQLADQLSAGGQPEAAQKFYDIAEKFRPKYSTTPQVMMVGGKPVNTLISESGGVKTLDGFDVKPDMVAQDLGGSTQWVDKNTVGNGQTFKKTMTPGEVASNNVAWAGNALTKQRMGLEFGTTEDGQNGIKVLAQGIADGSFPAPTGMALSNPRMVRALEMVKQINPNYDFTATTAKKAAATAFTSGNQGNAMRSFAVAGQHLDQLNTLVDALGNGNTNLVNKVAQGYSSQTGNPAPTNFDAAKDVVSKEVIKAIVGSGGGVAEREELAKTMSTTRSPAQLKGVINQYRMLMSAQHDALLEQRRAAGLPDSTLPNYTGASAPSAANYSVTAPNGKTYSFADANGLANFKLTNGLK